ncbi:hypothetical protein AcV7_002921 [Taiwanofungus camphoratus]|nr:hypothetical protein AcW2_006050 [Antrodia cinnamomea]KAI0941317.1 hypothetical protein AcV7_002921 [Antrodia cinnamomea]
MMAMCYVQVGQALPLAGHKPDSRPQLVNESKRRTEPNRIGLDSAQCVSTIRGLLSTEQRTLKIASTGFRASYQLHTTAPLQVTLTFLEEVTTACTETEHSTSRPQAF